MIEFSQVREEIAHYKDRYQTEKHNAEVRKKELESMEVKGTTLRKTLLHDD